MAVTRTGSGARLAVASVASALVVVAGSLAIAPPASGAVGPNGQIAFSTWNDNLQYDIYVTDPNDPQADPARLTTDGRYNGNPDWSPDGTRIAFDGWATFGGPRIQVMDIDPATNDATVISEPCAPAAGCYGDFQPQWSPDGTRIAFVSARNGSYELYVMDATGEVGSLPQATRLTTDPIGDSGSIEDSQVTWSPDGRRLAFLSTGRGSHPDACDLWVMDVRDADGDGFGDNLRRLTFDESFNCDAFEDVTPQWSPNSSLIAFTSTRSGYFDIWLVSANDPTDLRNVTQTPNGYEDQPSWSPDGTQIIFRAPANGRFELFSLPVPPATTAAASSDRTVEGGSRLRTAEITATATRTQLTFDGMRKTQSDWGRVPTTTPRTAVLTVERFGRGRVVSKPTGISCGPDCVSTYLRTKTVELRAIPRDGWKFERWGRSCTGTSTTCSVPMSQDRSVVARFAPLS